MPLACNLGFFVSVRLSPSPYPSLRGTCLRPHLWRLGSSRLILRQDSRPQPQCDSPEKVHTPLCLGGQCDTCRLSPAADAFSQLFTARDRRESPACYLYSPG